MSTVISNAYRFPLHRQRDVHRALMSNCVKLTRELVNTYVPHLVQVIDGKDVEDWRSALDAAVKPTMYPVPERRIRTYGGSDPERYVRAYLLHYHKFVFAYPSVSPRYGHGHLVDVHVG